MSLDIGAAMSDTRLFQPCFLSVAPVLRYCAPPLRMARQRHGNPSRFLAPRLGALEKSPEGFSCLNFPRCLCRECPSRGWDVHLCPALHLARRCVRTVSWDSDVSSSFEAIRLRQFLDPRTAPPLSSAARPVSEEANRNSFPRSRSIGEQQGQTVFSHCSERRYQRRPGGREKEV